MIDNLTISFEREDIAHTLNVPTRDENLPYNLATVFAEIIKQSDANANIVSNNLKDEFFLCHEEPELASDVKADKAKMKKMTNKELALVLQQSVEQFGELPLQIIYGNNILIGEGIRVELEQSCSKNSKAISIYTD